MSTPAPPAIRRTGRVLAVVGLRREAELLGRPIDVRIGSAGLSAAVAGAAGLVSFGLCGALHPGLRPGDLIVADAVVSSGERIPTDTAWSEALRAALAGACRGDLAGVDAIAATPAEKAALRAGAGAVAVDMESHHVARVASAARLPFAAVRAVSDGALRALPHAAQAGFRADGEPDVGAVIAALVRRPWELPDLIRTASEAGMAFRALRPAAAVLMRVGPPAIR